jgi:predicted  nucleic acid-binding Zn-ribbon protein
MELKANYEQLQEGYVSLEKEYLSLKSDVVKFKQLSDDLRTELARKEDSSKNMIYDLRRELDSATDLAEKQNALTITLESKVCIF